MNSKEAETVIENHKRQLRLNEEVLEQTQETLRKREEIMVRLRRGDDLREIMLASHEISLADLQYTISAQKQTIEGIRAHIRTLEQSIRG